MAESLQFFDMSVQVTPPTGYMEPLPITLGPNWQPNDVRLVFVSTSGISGGASLEMEMNPDPPTGFTAAYSLNPGFETHGVYYRRLQTGDSDSASVAWAKPTQWGHFMFGLVTVRGFSPTVNPTAGWLKLNQTAGDSTVVTTSVSVPSAGVMVLFAGSVPTPWGGSNIPSWAVSMGAPTGWTNLAATDKSGATFYPYGTDSSIVIVGKTFNGAGSTGVVSFPTSRGSPAFSGLYVFCTPAANVSATLTAA
jgi:hypothetical protein